MNVDKLDDLDGTVVDALVGVLLVLFLSGVNINLVLFYRIRYGYFPKL